MSDDLTEEELLAMERAWEVFQAWRRKWFKEPSSGAQIEARNRVVAAQDYFMSLAIPKLLAAARKGIYE